MNVGKWNCVRIFEEVEALKEMAMEGNRVEVGREGQEGGGIAMARCITCDHPFPEGTKKHPSYFAQLRLLSEDDEIDSFAQETTNILEYLEAVLMVAPEAREIGEDVELNHTKRTLLPTPQPRIAAASTKPTRVVTVALLPVRSLVSRMTRMPGGGYCPDLSTLTAVNLAS
jgi:hypothetical protein